MKNNFKGALVALALVCLANTAHADTKSSMPSSSNNGPGGAVIGSVTVQATVQSIDYKTRKVTLLKEDGSTVTLTVGPAARNFDQVKKGDNVKFEYVEALAIDVQKAQGQLGMDSDVTVARSPKGDKPAGMISETVTLKALVENINYKDRVVTLKGPEGNSMTLKVGDQAKRFNEVKKGDQVVVVYTEALGISVTPPSKG